MTRQNLHSTVRSGYRLTIPVGVLIACSGLGVAPSATFAQEQTPSALPAPVETDGERRLISQFSIGFVRDNPDLPDVDRVLAAPITLTPTPTGFVAPRPDAPTITTTLADLAQREQTHFYDSALATVAPAIVSQLQRLGLIGIYAEPDPAQIRVVSGQIIDTRAPGDTSLRYLITTGIVTEVRTVAQGDRIDPSEAVNNPIHRRIIERSPVRPADQATDTSTDLLIGKRIDDHVFFLNRHPGRRVDVAVAATGEQPGAVSLDYLVTENRPWLLFAQVSNTGTSETSDWRQRFGFIHNQLTNADDIFSVEYLTANFDDVHAVVASYERPIGSPRLRGRVYGSWYEYTASDVGQARADFSGRGYSFGAEAIGNVAQYSDLFVDAFAGLRYDRVRVENDIADITGREAFVIGYLGLRVEQNRDASRTFISGQLEYSLNGVDGDSVNELGRLDADERWVTLQGSASHSFYLEPLFDPQLAEGTSLAHEIAISARGQYAFDQRLVPNYQQVAGGLYSVRGYPESVVAGDSSLITSIEYRWHIPRGLDPNPNTAEFFGTPFRFVPQFQYGPTDWDLIFRAFVDIGRVWQSDAIRGLETDETLVGAGFGGELAFSRHFSARVDLGWALEEIRDASGRQEVDQGDFEVHLVLTVVF